MSSFFGELAKKLAERWMALLVLPGLLLVLTASAGLTLGHRSALDPGRLLRAADAAARDLGTRPPVAQVVFLALVLLASAAAGLAVTGLSGLTRRLWLGPWPRWLEPLGWPLLAWRRRRWEALDKRLHPALSEAERDRLAARRNRVALAKPTRATWMGDQIAAADSRVYHHYGADLQSWWPRLWLVLPEDTRAELRAARTGLDAASAQASWAFGYLLVATAWWPAALIAVGIGTVGWARGRAATRVYAELLEATVDLHAATLASQLRLIAEDEPPGERTGAQLTRRFRKAT